MMVDMAAITRLMKKWVDAHGLTIKEKASEYILGANGALVRIVGMTSMTLLLVCTLELDIASIAICLGNFYQGFLGCDLLCRYNEALSVRMHTPAITGACLLCH